MKNIKAIVFDFDGTLSLRSHAAYDKYRHDMKILFPHVDEHSIEFEAIVQNCITWDQYGTVSKKFVFDQLAKTYNLDKSITDDLASKWLDNFHLFQVLRDGVFDTLTELKKNYKLGCITNGDSKGQHSKLDICGLKPYFDSVIVSGDFGVHKPDPRIFIESCSQLGIEPDEMVYVGDTFYADVYGATLAGCTPVWLWPDRERPCQSDVHHIYSFSEIIEKVEEIKNK
ncbi:HAD family hydrolase [Anaerorhabdus sp.]|uniref:HAD family hydrolase n=1 Tax=Anaerorhabdus sp. TaxID=1872524 RepID=UPI002FC583C3